MHAVPKSLLAPLSLAALALLAGSASAQDLRFQAEKTIFPRPAVKALKDRRAEGGRAVELAGRASIRKRLGVPALTSIRVRAKGRRCKGQPRMVITMDRRRVGVVRVYSKRWRKYARRLRTRAGKRTFRIRLLNPRRTRSCARRLSLDSIRLVFRRPRPAPPPPSPPPVYHNPVHADTFPDPTVLDDWGRHNDYWAYATGDRFPMLRSSDLVHWVPAGNAMPERPAWASGQNDWNPWAPGVIQRSGACPGGSSPSCYVMFYVALNTNLSPATRCIGVATSAAPGGPFQDQGMLRDQPGGTDQSGRPVGCGDDGGYSNIDPAPFVDGDGQAYLYFSTTTRCPAPVPNGGCPPGPALSVVKLTPDLLRAASARTQVLVGDQLWEWGRIVENPWVQKRGPGYYLFYSGGDYQDKYGMGYAWSLSPTGPFVKAPSNPVLPGVNEGVSGAGGGMVVTGPHGGDWLVYHGRGGQFPAQRQLRIDPVVGAPNGGPVNVDGPTTTPQPERP